MNVSIAGNDRTAELEGAIAALAQTPPRHASVPLAPEHSALTLRDARDTGDYQDRLLRLLWLRRGITVSCFDPPGKSRAVRFLRARWRGLLWNLLRFQHEKMVFQRNVMGELLIGALEYERDRRRQELDEMRARLDALEQRARDGAP